MHRAYLDNNATTPVLPEVLDAMRPFFADHFGNASSIHHHGQETRAAVEHAREEVARLLGCRAYARVDFRLNSSEKPFILEVNPNPDFHPTGGLARSIRAAGLDQAQFAVELVHAALGGK